MNLTPYRKFTVGESASPRYDYCSYDAIEPAEAAQFYVDDCAEIYAGMIINVVENEDEADEQHHRYAVGEGARIVAS